MDDNNQQNQQQGGGATGDDNASQTTQAQEVAQLSLENSAIGTSAVTGGGQSSGRAGTKSDDSNMPQVSEEEVKNFDMRDFDPSLKPDLSTLSNDSLGKALGDKAGQFKGDGKTAAQQYDDIINVQIPSHNLSFDEMEFKTLLAGSISLLYEEKMAIIQQVPQLTQHKITELTRILNEEKKKFTQLNKKHQEELAKIEGKLNNTEEKEKLYNEEIVKKEGDQAAADEILKKLQGGG